MTSSEHMARCQAMPGGVTQSEKAIIADLRDMEALQEQNIEIVKQALAIGGEGKRRYYYRDLAEKAVESCAQERARGEAAEALLVEAREVLDAVKLHAIYAPETGRRIDALLVRLARKERA